MPSPLPTRNWRVIAYIVGDQEGLPPDEARTIDEVAAEEAKKMVRAARAAGRRCTGRACGPDADPGWSAIRCLGRRNRTTSTKSVQV